jgi:two-component system, cell cycle response regulator DivK
VADKTLANTVADPLTAVVTDRFTGRLTGQRTDLLTEDLTVPWTDAGVNPLTNGVPGTLEVSLPSPIQAAPQPTAATILLVEDNEMNCDMLTRRLQRRGYCVIPAVDGKVALDIAQTQPVDLILLDMNLPELDGWSVVRRLRAWPTAYHLPVIALTAHAMAGDRERCLAAGCTDYDTKPIEFPRLLSKIEASLRKP